MRSFLLNERGGSATVIVWVIYGAICALLGMVINSFANNGTIQGNVTWQTSGCYRDGGAGPCLQFGGTTSDRVSIGNVSLGTTWTFVAIVKRSAGSGTKTIIDINNGSSVCYLRFGEATANVPNMACGGGLSIGPSTPNISDGNYHVIVGVRDGSSAYLYADNGSDLSRIGSDTSFTTGSFTGTANHIGVEKWGASYYVPWDGRMQEVRIYNTALSGPTTNCATDSNNDICDIYNSGTFTTCQTGETGLVSCWRMYDGTGSTVTDAPLTPDTESPVWRDSTSPVYTAGIQSIPADNIGIVSVTLPVQPSNAATCSGGDCRSDNIGITAIKVWYEQSGSCGTAVDPDTGTNSQTFTTTPLTTTSVTVTGLFPNTAYCFEARLIDAAGNKSVATSEQGATTLTFDVQSNKLTNTDFETGISEYADNWRWPNYGIIKSDDTNGADYEWKASSDCPANQNECLELGPSVYGNTYVEIQDESYYDLTGNMTIMGWIRLKNVGISQRISSKGHPTGTYPYAYDMKVASDNKFGIFFSTGSSYVAGTYNTTSLSANTWHHIAASYNQSTGAILICLDGACETDTNTPIGATFNTSRKAIIGAYDWTTKSNFMEGRFDEFAIFNTNLSQATIQTYCGWDTSTCAGYEIPDTSANLISLHRFNQTTGNIVESHKNTKMKLTSGANCLSGNCIEMSAVSQVDSDTIIAHDLFVVNSSVYVKANSGGVTAKLQIVDQLGNVLCDSGDNTLKTSYSFIFMEACNVLSAPLKATLRLRILQTSAGTVWIDDASMGSEVLTVGQDDFISPHYYYYKVVVPSRTNTDNITVSKTNLQRLRDWGYARDDSKDISVAYHNGTSWADIARDVESGSIEFTSQDTSTKATGEKYMIYFGNANDASETTASITCGTCLTGTSEPAKRARATNDIRSLQSSATTNDTNDYGFGGNQTTGRQVGVLFTPSATDYYQYFEYLARQRNTTNILAKDIIVEIWNTSAGLPTTVISRTRTASYPIEKSTGVYQWMPVYFPSAIQLTNGTQYAITFQVNGVGSSTQAINFGAETVGSGGSLVYRTRTSSSWNSWTADATKTGAIKVYTGTLSIAGRRINLESKRVEPILKSTNVPSWESIYPTDGNDVLYIANQIRQDGSNYNVVSRAWSDTYTDGVGLGAATGSSLTALTKKNQNPLLTLDNVENHQMNTPFIYDWTVNNYKMYWRSLRNGGADAEGRKRKIFHATNTHADWFQPETGSGWVTDGVVTYPWPIGVNLYNPVAWVDGGVTYVAHMYADHDNEPFDDIRLIIAEKDTATTFKNGKPVYVDLTDILDISGVIHSPMGQVYTSADNYNHKFINIQKPVTGDTNKDWDNESWAVSSQDKYAMIAPYPVFVVNESLPFEYAGIHDVMFMDDTTVHLVQANRSQADVNPRSLRYTGLATVSVPEPPSGLPNKPYNYPWNFPWSKEELNEENIFADIPHTVMH